MATTKVLLVEDESFTRAIMVEFLFDAGFDVDGAHDGDEAVQLLDADGYTLLITDLSIPGQANGLDVAEQFRNHKPGYPILVVSVRRGVLSKFQEKGIEATVLPKPFDPDHFVAVVSQLAEGANR